jgi:hypothetical protein
VDERAKEDLGGEQSPWKDRAVRHWKRRGIATDSSAEQGLEVGHSAVERAGASFRKRMAHRRAKPSPAPRDTSVDLTGVRSEQPAPGSEPSHGSGLASVSRTSADLRIRTNPEGARSRSRDLLWQEDAARQRGASQRARAARPRSRRSLPRRRGRARKRTSRCAGTSVPPQPPRRGEHAPNVDDATHCVQPTTGGHLGGSRSGARSRPGGPRPPET